MSTIKDKLYFNYDGVSSRTYNIINVSLDSGMFEDNLNASREVIETRIRGKDESLFHYVDEGALEFEMVLAFEGTYEEKTLEDVVLWLFKDGFKPLYFEGSEDRIYYCTPVGDPKIFHNGLRQGYITITMKTSSSKIYSDEKTTQIYYLDDNIYGFDIDIENEGHVDMYPEISIEKIDDGDIIFETNGKITEIKDLSNGEKVYINSEKEIIESDIIGIYRYNNINGNLDDIVLKRGSNTIKIYGNCIISFRYVFKYRF